MPQQPQLISNDSPESLKGTNPLLPVQFFVPDVEAHTFPDGRLYLYGSFDRKGVDDYCSKAQHLFSTADMRNFYHHGEILHTDKHIPWTDHALYAPDAIDKDGKYFVYVCCSDRTQGVAIGESPAGPFETAKQIKAMSGIDPAVFVDDDGQGYIYWGQNNNVRAAKLTDDMTDIVEESRVQPLTKACHFFHEGSSMRKRNGIYYYVFADTSRRAGRPTCLGYATSHSPMGPFTYRGVIIDNYGCDPYTWNNHGSIECFNGQWYVFYHRSTRNACYNRRVCVEKLAFTRDGLIPEVQMTSNGAALPIPAKIEIPAYLACTRTGHCYFDETEDGVEALCNLHHGDTATFRRLDFSSPVTQLVLSVALNETASVEVLQDGISIGQAKNVEIDGQGVITIPVAPQRSQSEIVLNFYSRTRNVIGCLKSLVFR